MHTQVKQTRQASSAAFQITDYRLQNGPKRGARELSEWQEGDFQVLTIVPAFSEGSVTSSNHVSTESIVDQAHCAWSERCYRLVPVAQGLMV
jgi:hypothetical protein